MELQRALELHTEYAGQARAIRVDANNYICLNDMAAYFPDKRVDHWLANQSTKDLITIIEKNLIPGKSGIIAKKGKGGGTYAHDLIAFDFATWLSVEFKLKVYFDYINGTQHKEDWNIKRIMAAFNYKIMTASIKDAHELPKTYHYSNEALMINEIIFGVREGTVRDTATEKQLDDISKLEGSNSAFIDIGMEYQDRKEKLKMMYDKIIQKSITP